MEKTTIKSVFFTKLKGLENVEIKFDRPLTAIMGVNGAGKTTIIHALACIYSPCEGEGGENHTFPEFFVPNTDALWEGSEFSVINEIDGREGRREVSPPRTYRKAVDRWSPRYGDRPKRNVYYIGIDSCLPEIEKNNVASRIIYTSTDRLDRISQRTLELSAYVLNKDYTLLVDNEYHEKHFLGVITRSGLRYSSLSMGTGEQRTIKIIEKALSAEPYSLILIDEIDLLLHVCALRRLVEKLYAIAADRHLQIVFTTHSLEMLSLDRFVGLQYIDVLRKSDGRSTVMVYDKPNSDIVRSITGCTQCPIRICVEDDFSKAIMMTIIRKLGMRGKVKVTQFGAAINAFTYVSGLHMSGVNTDNILAVLDGDIYRTKEDKEERIKKVYSGTECNINEKREKVLSCITQYALPEGTKPEEFMYNLLLRCDPNNEVVQAAMSIRAVDDKHRLISILCDLLQEDMNQLVGEIVEMCEKFEEWQNYIAPVEEWLKDRMNL